MIDIKKLENYPVSDLPAFKLTEAFYKGSCAIENFVSSVVLNVLSKQFKLSKKEKVVIETYYRMYFWLCSIISLNSPKKILNMILINKAKRD